MKMFAKWGGAVLAAFLALLVCNGANAAADEKKIALMWVGKAGMARRVSMGFLPRLKELAPDMKVSVRMELKDMDAAKKLFKEFSEKMDGIVFLRSSGAKFLAVVKPEVPCFVGGCNNPVFLGAVDNMESPGGMVTGVTYYIPYEKRFKALKTLFPDVKSICLLLEKGHPSAPIDREGTKTQCEKLGIAYSEIAADNLDNLLKQSREAAEDNDLFIIGQQALVLDNTPGLVKISKATRTPLFSYSDAPVKRGALVGLAARDRLLGKMLADSVIEVVVNGTPISEVPVKTDPDPTISLNEKTMEFFELKVPPKILQNARIIRER